MPPLHEMPVIKVIIHKSHAVSNSNRIEIRFELALGRLTILKKMGPIMSDI